MLRQGRDTWNAWRLSAPSESIWLKRVEMRGLDLSGYDLHGVDFEGSDLSQSTLTGANLSGAHLPRAKMCWAKASRADFSNAWIINADLRFSNFEDCTFEGATLSGSNLTSSSFCRSRMKGASMMECRTSEYEDSAPGYTYFDNADLSNANLVHADLNGARMAGVNLTGASLNKADLSGAVLTGAILRDAKLPLATLSHADMSHAKMEGANLEQTIMVRTSLEHAELSRCRVYGVAAWDLKLAGATQLDLVITPSWENGASIQVDDIEVAQFIYLLMSQQRLQSVIDTITSKAVLILGRFTPERKAVLDALRDALRSREKVPIIFDFEKPANRDLTETVRLLAHMARFVVADLTSPKSVPHELMALVPLLPSVPFQLLIHGDEAEYPMVEHLQRYPWVLPTQRYDNPADLIACIDTAIIQPAEALAEQLRPQPVAAPSRPAHKAPSARGLIERRAPRRARP